MGTMGRPELGRSQTSEGTVGALNSRASSQDERKSGLAIRLASKK